MIKVLDYILNDLLGKKNYQDFAVNIKYKH